MNVDIPHVDGQGDASVLIDSCVDVPLPVVEHDITRDFKIGEESIPDIPDLFPPEGNI